LKREGMSRLEDVIPKAEGETIAPKQTFKDYKPGFIHIDIKYLPQMPDETSRRYLFVAIDRATRWVFMHVYGDTTDKSSVDFLRRLKLASPIKISKILTDNDSIHRAFCRKGQEAKRQARIRRGLHFNGCRAPPRAATAPANERHGRALQWPHPRTAAAN
jgi:hypothetical protein